MQPNSRKSAEWRSLVMPEKLLPWLNLQASRINANWMNHPKIKNNKLLDMQASICKSTHMSTTNQAVKQTIQVRRYGAGLNHHYTDQFELVETIRRKPWLESIGNFCPMFCRYKGKRTLVHSDAGDLSDPFRANQSYLKTLFIEV